MLGKGWENSRAVGAGEFVGVRMRSFVRVRLSVSVGFFLGVRVSMSAVRVTVAVASVAMVVF
jgi:hypothetical protein